MNACSRRSFLVNSAVAALGAGMVSPGISTPLMAYPRPNKNAISLATWSIVRSFRAGIWKLTDVARICREDFGIDGIEYVNSFFEVPVDRYLKRLNNAADEHGMRNVLIMVDSEGNMVSKDAKERKQAVINHRKWVEIAAYLGCHAIRCNARGGGASPMQDPDALDRAEESFGALIEYAKEFKINVLIENHGGLSSFPDWLPTLARSINSPNFGILPDYGNYDPSVDRSEAVRKAMPFAMGVSVKAGWQPDGTHPHYDLEKLLAISKSAGYSGFWGIESSIRRGRGQGPSSPEATQKDDWQAVRWTKAVIEKVVLS